MSEITKMDGDRRTFHVADDAQLVRPFFAVDSDPKIEAMQHGMFLRVPQDIDEIAVDFDLVDWSSAR